MGRSRVIDRTAVLDAAQKVVSQQGATKLTLDAVACEAGISKASVLYDYKTKHALIKAVIERRVGEDEARLREAVARQGAVPSALIRARIATAGHSISHEDRAVALSLCAALAQDSELSQPIQQAFGRRIEEIKRDSEHPRGALLAFLAIEGMLLLDYFGLYSWPDALRENLIKDINWLIDEDPAPRTEATDGPSSI